MAKVRFYYDVEIDEDIYREDFELKDDDEISDEDIINRARTLLGYSIQDRAINVGDFACEIVEEEDEQIGKYTVCVLNMETYIVYAKSERDAIVKAMDKFVNDDMFYGTKEADNVTQDDCRIIYFEGE
jgi:hypothetical protein